MELTKYHVAHTSTKMISVTHLCSKGSLQHYNFAAGGKKWLFCPLAKLNNMKPTMAYVSLEDKNMKNQTNK